MDLLLFTGFVLFGFWFLCFGFWFLCSGFIFLSYLFWVFICILLCLRPEITRRIWLAQPITRAVRFDLNIQSATGLFSGHPILSVRVQIRSKPNPTRPVDSSILYHQLRFWWDSLLDFHFSFFFPIINISYLCLWSKWSDQREYLD